MPVADHHLSLAAAQLLEHYNRCGLRLIPRGEAAGVLAWFDQHVKEFPQHLTSLEDAATALAEPGARPPIGERSSTPVAAPDNRPAEPPRRETPTLDGTGLESQPGTWTSPELPVAERIEVLKSQAEIVAGCTRCPELVCSRSRTVYGVGQPQPQLVFIGEGPGAEEDRRGEPFVGAAGELLNKIIAAMKLRREDVYIMNAIKCRPENNRTPSDLEIANCHDYFETQLETLQPRFIICLGVVAARALLKTNSTIGRLRSRFHHYRGADVMVTYHPAYLLRTPEAKRATWEDVQMVMAAMQKHFSDGG